MAPSPFDDPDFRAEMARKGVRHQPGLAAELMEQIAPLLADEGIDLDDLDADDLESVNAALGRATERHNMTLMTPIGPQREGTIVALREITTALAGGDLSGAGTLLDSIPSQATGDQHTVAHVIGTALGLLDTWFASEPVRVARARVPRWTNRRSRTAATDILSLARKTRAFDSADSLHRSHSGHAIFEGAALAVTGAITAWAEADGVPVAALAARLLPGERTVRPSAAGSAFRRAPQPSPHRATQNAFEAWLIAQAPDIAAPTPENEMTMFSAIVELADFVELDIAQPDELPALLDTLYDDTDDDFPIDAAVETLHDYVHFQLETATDPDAWTAVHEEFDDGDGAELADALADLIAQESETDPAARATRIRSTRIVSAIPALLEWIGRGRPVTQTGNLRRADIAHAASLIGVSAVGAARQAPYRFADFDVPDDQPFPDPDTFTVQSMSEVPQLAAWWEVLRLADVIEVTGTRVRPGTADLDDDATLGVLVALYVSETLLDLDRWGDSFGGLRISATLRELQHALAPESDLPAPVSIGSYSLRPSALRILARLRALGLLESDATGAPIVPSELRGTVARGILMAISVLSSADLD